MLRYIRLILSIGVFTIEVLSVHGQNLLGKQHNPIEILGETTNYLQPHLLIEKYGADWSIEVDYLAQTNFSRNTWLKITNRIGSRLQLCLTNGMELQSTNLGVLAAMNLPSQTTVSNVLCSIPWRWRPAQWLRTNPTGVGIGDLATSANFSLQSAFDVSFTNDVVLQITPLIYKVETNEVTAHLIEFLPIKMKLLSNGEVQKLP